MYTLLGLLIAEEHGLDFGTEAVAAAWVKYLPFACTAEKVTLEHLRQGRGALRAGMVRNPYCEWIGGDIRCDAWGYLAPGCPERAAGLAWRDARLSHRWNGVYGAMFFAASISAAFATGDAIAALRIGLTEIPRACALARAVRWALRLGPVVRDYRAARAAVDRRFAGMDAVHTINNACLTIFGLHIGGRDFSRVIGETVAMGLDNDCTAATAGSIFGAAYGRGAIPACWTAPFGDTMHSYLRGVPRLRISGVLRRFERCVAAGW
jgi:ADP-ribosylglycohydrolase